MRAQVWVEIPDGYELACEEMRPPKIGEKFIDAICGQARKCTCDTIPPRVIVREAYEWPEWLTAEWIAMDTNAAWYAYADEPRMLGGSGSWSGEHPLRMTGSSHIAFAPPHCTDWRQSKRRNPNKK